jgi:imidazole glycerol-phosphate synthase subunit HisH
MRITLIDYGAGNLRSAARALLAAGADSVDITGDAGAVAKAERIVLPGVGAFGACAAALRAVPGMVEALEAAVIGRRVPFLGICVGMQLMADEGHEFGVHKGLGWIAGSVQRMAPAGLKVPQIGWNLVEPTAPGLLADGYGYFVHSYAFAAADAADIAAFATYGAPIVAAVRRENMLGVQFHPEKSQGYGLALLRRWLETG